MSRQLLDLEAVLRQLVGEHRKLLAHLEAHLTAMKRFDLKAMDDAASLQEASRARVALLETRRRMATAQVAKVHKLEGDVTMTRLAATFPARSKELLALRAELKGLMEAVTNKAYVAGRVAGAVLGHLNTAVRLLTGAVQKAGVYTKQGVPKVAARIGMMEAVG